MAFPAFLSRGAGRLYVERPTTRRPNRSQRGDRQALSRRLHVAAFRQGHFAKQIVICRSASGPGPRFVGRQLTHRPRRHGRIPRVGSSGRAAAAWTDGPGGAVVAAASRCRSRRDSHGGAADCICRPHPCRALLRRVAISAVVVSSLSLRRLCVCAGVSSRP